MKKVVVGFLAFLLCFGLVFVAAAEAGPPPHARGGSPPGHSDGHPGGENSPSPEESDVTGTAGNEDNGVEENGEEEPEEDFSNTPPGLRDKGGLPPGLHGRSVDELPPGIRYNPNFQDAIQLMREEEQLKENINGIQIVGEAALPIPQEGETTEAEYEAYAVDSEEEKLSKVEAEWSLLQEEIAGVSLEGNTLKITSEAAPETEVIIEATYITVINEQEKTFKDQLDIMLYAPEVKSIVIEGEKYLAFEEGDEGPLAVQYTARVKDQNGKVMDGEDVEWEVEGEEAGIAVDEEGKVSIEQLPEDDLSFTLTAVSKSDPDVEEEIVVTVYKQEFVRLEIAGEKLVALENEAEEETIILVYEALLIDNKDQVMEKEEMELEWSVDLEDFDLDAEGAVQEEGNQLTLELPVEEGELSITATLNGDEAKSDTLSVVLYFPEPYEITIKGADSITIPAKEEEVTETYEALLKDQQGQVVEGKEVVWALDVDANGITFDAESATLTVTEDAEDGSLQLTATYEVEEDEDLEATFDIELVEDNGPDEGEEEGNNA